MLRAPGIRPVAWSSEGSRVSETEVLVECCQGDRQAGEGKDWKEKEDVRWRRRRDVPIRMRSLEGLEMSSLI
jgi:hypothetical protein